MKFFIVLLLFISLFMSAYGQTEIDVLSNPKKIDLNINLRSPDNCAECAIMNRNQQCPTAYNYFINETVKPSFYSWFVDNKMMDTCLSFKKQIPLTLSSSRTEELLSDSFGNGFHVSQPTMEKCFKSNSIKDKDQEDEKKVLTAYMMGLNKNIIDTKKEKLEEMASVDNLLNVPPLKDVNCYEHKAHCEELKKCEPNNQFNEIADFSMTGMNELVALEGQLNDLRDVRSKASTAITTPAQYDAAVNDVKEKISYIRSLTPWLDGDEISAKLPEIKSLIKAGKEEEAQALFKKRFTLQLQNTREIQKQNYNKMNIAQLCLTDNSFCTPKIMDSMNNYYKKAYGDSYNKSGLTLQEKKEVNLLKDSGMCIANLKDNKDGLDELNKTVGQTLAGLVVGGVGGVMKLGGFAVKFLQAGSRIKGVASIVLLGTEALSINDSFQSISSSCEESLRTLKNSNVDSTNNLCGDSAKNIYKYSSLKSCVFNVAMTTIPYALSIRGLGKGKVSTEISAQLMAAEKTILVRKITNPLFGISEKEEIAKALQRLHLSPAEMEDSLKNINKVVKTQVEKNRLRDYVNYVTSLEPSEQKLAINELHNIALLSSDMSPGSYVQKFYNKENKFYLYEKLKANTFKKALLKRGDTTEAEAEKVSQILARESRAKLQRRYYSCQSKTATPEHITAAKRYMGISTALGIGGTAYGNYKTNKDKFESDKGEWFAKLGYDIAMTLIMSKLSSKMVKASPDNIGVKYLKANGYSAVVGGLDAKVYSSLYGVSEEEAIAKIEQIQNSPEAQKELKILEAYIEKTGMDKKFTDSIVSDYNKVLSSPDKETILGKPPYQIGDTTFNDLTPKDLENPAIKEKLAAALVRQMNSGEGNPLISTGDKGADRWINDRMWNAAIGIPKGMIVGMGIYKVLCLGVDSPFTSLGIVTGIQFVNQFISGENYYTFRKKMIGQ